MVVCHVVPVAAKALHIIDFNYWDALSFDGCKYKTNLVFVSVNADVSEAVGRGYHGDPVLVGLEGLLQVHHGRRG